ncbi:MAG: cytochrome bc complex cytochrome b subunit [Chloroflexi bacterium]|nr:cytochrome bc complex cytochrome b subunit [Chloroflexota bacterium]
MTEPTLTRPPVWQRIWRSIVREPFTGDRRSRLRLVMNNLILHLHPSQVPARTLRFTYTWGLGGLSGLLVVILAVTGMLLETAYTPSPDKAYTSILALSTRIWFGQFIRNLHHWSGNLMIIVVALHMLRVFFTGAFRAPREFNWLVGIALLLLTVIANFTGYLLPWDQLAYWAITVGSSIIVYIPLIGNGLANVLLGGPDIGPTTLLNFYAFHISIIPMAILVLMSLHFWRVRKDGGLSLPRSVDEPPVNKDENVLTVADLVRPEAVWATVALAGIVLWSAFVNAPLEALANPDASPNPAKAAWYFMGIQELLLHFHPLIGAIIVPTLGLLGMVALPYMDSDMDSVGIYFRSRRGRWLALFSAASGAMATALYVVLDEFFIDWAGWFYGLPAIISNGVLPLILLLLGVIGYYEFVRRVFRATKCEGVLSVFVLVLAGFIVLTLVGVFFRGAGMKLMFPWQIVTIH